jgi:hypothetical protein
MNNPWKVATLALVLTAVIALSTGLTTAYVMRGPDAPISSAPASVSTVPPTVERPVVQPVVAAAPTKAPARAAVAPRTVNVASAPATVVPPAATPMAADCGTGADRAMKIAKPGLVGTLAGAGLGAIGGAIADGGGGAGKGALIGGLTGAALGGGYGAYKTKQECGTIFGSTGLSGF